jgi:hypothetical protein
MADMRSRLKIRNDRDSARRVRALRKTTPASSHPEIEEDIDRSGCALDERQLKIEKPRLKAKPIVSVDGQDVKDRPFRKNRAA